MRGGDPGAMFSPVFIGSSSEPGARCHAALPACSEAGAACVGRSEASILKVLDGLGIYGPANELESN